MHNAYNLLNYTFGSGKCNDPMKRPIKITKLPYIWFAILKWCIIKSITFLGSKKDINESYDKTNEIPKILLQ